ncbi:MAG TPA: hypothetical protein VF916_12240 [Ktedonobacterales bacterium]
MATAKAPVPRMCPECRRRLAEQHAELEASLAAQHACIHRTLAETKVILGDLDRRTRGGKEPTDAEAR